MASGAAPHVKDAFAFLEPEALDEPHALFELELADAIVRLRELLAVVGERRHTEAAATARCLVTERAMKSDQSPKPAAETTRCAPSATTSSRA